MDYIGTVYCYISPSGKCYIGQTTRNPRRRRHEHISAAKRDVGSMFHRAIKKYGIDNFLYKELAIVHSEDKHYLCNMLDQLEKEYIKQYKESGIQLYNLTEGGDSYYDNTGKHLSEERKQNIGRWSKEWHSNLTPEERAALCKSISEGRKKPILQYSVNGEFIKEWPSASDVPFARQNAISMCLRGKNKTCAGYIWKYKDE